MSYTEIKERNKRKYYYRVLSVRKGKNVSKERKYLGVNLSKEALVLREKEADYLFSEAAKSKKIRILEELIPKILEVLKKYRIKKAGIFGSYARGEQKRNSDVDILVEPAPGMGFSFYGMNLELEDKLKKKVDLVSYNGLSPYLKDRILSQEVRIL